MQIHYSIRFKDFDIPHHGEVTYPISAYQNYGKYKESMISFVRADLSKRLSKWGFSANQMVSAEFYFYRGAKEFIFFKWEKETETTTSTIK